MNENGRWVYLSADEFANHDYFDALDEWQPITPVVRFQVTWINGGTGSRSVKSFDRAELAHSQICRTLRSGGTVLSIDAIRSSEARPLGIKEDWNERRR